MNPRDLIARMRDVHLPPVETTSPEYGFTLWPLLVFAALVVLVSIAIWWRGRAWRREARERLDQIAGLKEARVQWSQLLDLGVQVARASGRSTPLPISAYHDPATVTDANVADLRDHIAAEVRR